MELLSRDSLRIVHVDDDDNFIELGERFLKRAGFKLPIVRCADGIMAIDYFSKVESDNAPHVILSDLHMPRMNGLGVLYWVRKNYRERDIAVYLLTSSEEPLHIRRAAALGVTEYLPKRAIFDHLIQKLNELITTNNERYLAWKAFAQAG